MTHIKITQRELDALTSASALIETHAEDEPELWRKTLHGLNSVIRKYHHAQKANTR